MLFYKKNVIVIIYMGRPKTYNTNEERLSVQNIKSKKYYHDNKTNILNKLKDKRKELKQNIQ
jgi:hypothetical protein